MAKTVAVVGTGYVGLVTALGLVDQGHRVLCVDVDPAKVEAVARGVAVFYEEGVDAALRRALDASRLSATTETAVAVRDSDFTFLCVGTPSRPDGSMDDGQVRAAARAIGVGLRGRQGPHVVVVKSTVTPGTTEEAILPELGAASGGRPFGLCVNPEFLREGDALRDALHPDRIVIGQWDAASGDALAALYAGQTCPILRCDIRTAEMIKHATNAFLATKVSFANELANLCERFRVDADAVVRGMGLDSRINPRFMVPGVGFGGSCLPKDLRAIVAAANHMGYAATLFSAVLDLNERQPLRAVEMLEGELGNLKGARVAILGVAFKSGTDDVRESRAIPIARALLDRGATVVAYDPVAGANFAKAVPAVALAKTAKDALRGAHGCIIQADWHEFRELPASAFAAMARPVVVDGRRTLDPRALGDGVVYRRIG